jgi:hypothetical protein
MSDASPNREAVHRDGAARDLVVIGVAGSTRRARKEERS